MTEPQKLSAAQIQDDAPADWRQILNRLKARFRTGDLATGTALAGRIGEIVDGALTEPEVTVTRGDVVVALWTPVARGITADDLDVARAVSAAAADLDAPADTGGLTQLELGLDTGRSDDLGPFYAALLGAELQRGEPVDPTGQVPTVWWQDPAELDPDYALPEKGFEQRWHFDVWVPHDEAERRVAAVVAAGGRVVSDAAAPSFWVVEDAEGNRSCVCTPHGR